MFLGPSDPDALVRGTKPDSSIINSQILRKTLIPTVLCLLSDFLSLKNYVDVPVPPKSNKQKFFINNNFLLAS
jgi:hypothetical protein